MIFYEEVYDKINEDYLNGEISYEMAEAANDLAYNSYITMEEAENAASPQPDQGKVKSLLSKFASKLTAMAGKCNVISNALAKLKGKTDTVEQNIGELNANGGKCADGKVENPKKSIKDDKATKFKAMPTAGKAVIGTGLVFGGGFITYKEYKKHEDTIKAAIKKIQQELAKIASDTVKVIKEYTLTVNWKVVATGAAVGAAGGAGVATGMNHSAAKRNNETMDFKKAFNKKTAIGAGVGAGVGLISSVMIQKKMKQIEEESGVKAMISKIIAAVEAFAKNLGVALDKATTTMFAKFKKSK